MRTMILTAYLQNPGSFAPAYVYAWANRMPAVGLANAESVFWRSDNMRIAPEIVRSVEDVVNNLIAKRHLESLAYDRLSKKPGVVAWGHYLDTILGYYSLKGDYSLEVKNALRVNMPSNKSLVTTFGPEMVTFPS
jgi:hypothetical protein